MKELTLFYRWQNNLFLDSLWGTHFRPLQTFYDKKFEEKSKIATFSC
jgi:hypothetical protein